MTCRSLAFMLLAFVSQLAVPTPGAGQETVSAPRTPWGHPALQGLWTNTTTTPLERPDDLDGREFLTQEEWAERNPGSGISTCAAGAYNDFWLEKGGEQLTLIERFTRVDDDTIGYEVTVTDPDIWSAPWTVSMPMTAMEDVLYEYACHEGNYAMGTMLAGARVEEGR